MGIYNDYTPTLYTFREMLFDCELLPTGLNPKPASPKESSPILKFTQRYQEPKHHFEHKKLDNHFFGLSRIGLGLEKYYVFL